MSRIVVVGSINMDIVNQVEQFPLPGQTIHGRSTVYVPGGKGANQAVAAAKSGAKVSMVGAVGQDAFGSVLIRALQDAGVETDSVVSKDGTSGLAFITVSSAGENQIILSAGSNGKLAEDDIPDSAAFSDTGYILLQNEIPWPANRYVLLQARKRAIPVIANPAPALHIADEDLALINTLVLNETEAAFMTGGMTHPHEIAASLIRRGVREVVLTMGEQGCFAMNQAGNITTVGAYRVHALDTTAAGDTFIGAMAAARLSGSDTVTSLRFASAAAALSVTKPGAQSSIPDQADTLRLMNEQAV
jgi:ribokinase